MQQFVRHAPRTYTFEHARPVDLPATFLALRFDDFRGVTLDGRPFTTRTESTAENGSISMTTRPAIVLGAFCRPCISKCTTPAADSLSSVRVTLDGVRVVSAASSVTESGCR